MAPHVGGIKRGGAIIKRAHIKQAASAASGENIVIDSGGAP